MTEKDLEKLGDVEAPECTSIPSLSLESTRGRVSRSWKSRLTQWNAKIENLPVLEARSIKRVLPEEQYKKGTRAYVQMIALWFSINLSATNIVTGLLGLLLFGVGGTDCAWIVILANTIASLEPAYISGFGPLSGNRTMARRTSRRSFLIISWFTKTLTYPRPKANSILNSC